MWHGNASTNTPTIDAVQVQRNLLETYHALFGKPVRPDNIPGTTGSDGSPYNGADGKCIDMSALRASEIDNVFAASLHTFVVAESIAKKSKVFKSQEGHIREKFRRLLDVSIAESLRILLGRSEAIAMLDSALVAFLRSPFANYYDLNATDLLDRSKGILSDSRLKLMVLAIVSLLNAEGFPNKDNAPTLCMCERFPTCKVLYSDAGKQRAGVRVEGSKYTVFGANKSLSQVGSTYAMSFVNSLHEHASLLYPLREAQSSNSDKCTRATVEGSELRASLELTQYDTWWHRNPGANLPEWMEVFKNSSMMYTHCVLTHGSRSHLFAHRYNGLASNLSEFEKTACSLEDLDAEEHALCVLREGRKFSTNAHRFVMELACSISMISAILFSLFRGWVLLGALINRWVPQGLYLELKPVRSSEKTDLGNHLIRTAKRYGFYTNNSVAEGFFGTLEITVVTLASLARWIWLSGAFAPWWTEGFITNTMDDGILPPITDTYMAQLGPVMVQRYWWLPTVNTFTIHGFVWLLITFTSVYRTTVLIGRSRTRRDMKQNRKHVMWYLLTEGLLAQSREAFQESKSVSESDATQAARRWNRFGGGKIDC